MAKDKINPILLVVVVIAAIYLIGNANLFSISLQSPQVQYYNAPIIAKFSTNLSSPTITAYFDNVELFETNPEDSNITTEYTKEIINGTYMLVLKNITEEGLFKFVATEGNATETQTIEVKQPYVDVKHDIINIIEKGTTDTIVIQTYTPQGDKISADAVEIDVYDPDNKLQTLTPTKKGDNWEMVFNYKDAGNYQFKITARKDGFATKEFTAITTVTKSEGIHPIIWIWGGAILVWFILFGLKRRFWIR